MPFKINLLENIGGVIMNEKPAGKVVEVNIDRIYPNPNQPRRKFTEEDLKELPTRIKTHRLIHPIHVHRIEFTTKHHTQE